MARALLRLHHAALLALLGLGACMPGDAELRITDPDGLATAEQLDWIAEQLSRFTALTGPDRIGLDEIRVVPGRYEEGMSGFVFGRFVRRGGVRRVELTEELVLGRNETFFRHELCHALDDQEGISGHHADLLDPDLNQDVSWGYHLPDGHPEAEVFALLCDDGPPAIYDIYGDQECGLGLEDRAVLLHDEVYVARPDLPTGSGGELQVSLRWWDAMPPGLNAAEWVPFEGGLLQLYWLESEEGWERVLMVAEDGAFTPVPLPEIWADEALHLWPGLDGQAWIVSGEAMAPIYPDGTVGASLPASEEVTRGATHAVVLDEDRVLIYLAIDRGGPGYSVVRDRETGEPLHELDRIVEDRSGFTVLDGEVWVRSGDPANAGLYRLTEEGWVLRPGPLGGSTPVLHQGQLMQRWSPDYWLNEDGLVGGLAVLHEDGSWTPLGGTPCQFEDLPGLLVDTGEKLLLDDAVGGRLGEVELGW
ncbi:MAG: hypothetical protein H6741_07220 [Alphaproteobacteria bacterium]|nr:hypothetical protein [Alphaproteobacteria bacterium]